MDERAVIVGGGPCGLVRARSTLPLGRLAPAVVATTVRTIRFTFARIKPYEGVGARRG